MLRKLVNANRKEHEEDTGTEPLLVEQAHVKDALSRLLVEMVKREWPQQWPSLMDELHALCTMGVSALSRATPWPANVRGLP
ncbi:chromosome region maintenance protein 5/exportin, putative [Ixodes scapularis]|uniref:Chromosome region maintenance protein 5/exportin, putative n=1 Tax=Ixodes scapularis TaxID=6945 RepID=B7PU87_IXOSC|nr:chromosome region maintenance protein 5/exportin, putative [Ixodes scapularis]|eukprot:XP_002405719.1 chromosome region maintenance protein 5/exportin, putative [Ixodes scapularis]